jgi:CBS domain-containing protein
MSTSYLVVQGEQLVGLMTLSDIRHVPREQWAQISVSEAMIPLERLHVVSPQQPLSDVLPLMAGRDVNQLPVVQHDALVGVVSRDAIVHYLEVRRSLSGESSKKDAQNGVRHAA